ncbi:MAG: permease-like cell division protein FtsX [Firmicutes bacterium]|nr:permease-like cell division protein FtsX [Dethiobacter sp.]MBS3889670.1 permease-like cell division protein FtsX [Bacillota bacterium]MBS4054656.1 permease-like cell division protein FtsX [Thermaerobacter sp.]
MNLNALTYCLRQGLVSLRRNIWLALVTSSMIAVSLAILGGFLLLSLNVGQIMRNVDANVEIAVFLTDKADRAKVESALTNLEGVKSLSFVSREQGLAEFGQSFGDQGLFAVLEGEHNPLPNMFRVRAEQAVLVPNLAASMQGIPGVDVVDYGEDMVAQLLSVTSWLNSMFLVVSLFLGLGAVLLIVTIIKLSVMARQEEIGVMKFLGASDSFIRLPFILEGASMGAVGALTATLGLAFAYNRLAASLQNGALTFLLQPITAREELWPIFFALLVIGFLIGGVGSILSVRKFLRA